ncbi:hypothetical protein [Geotalea uraniireducens]|uniref:Uncharacterized protein n=1 Tax=Geotalea uraniireducens (strain Rf4) TaxID=351605 RepID=A5G6U5_GEOUR|nr:hypothetical protein [Geotalea uraniireducens]ABQ27513.1 hypothetical protein Gura_3356 [Geotalea uraniireducens Rf4]
MIIKNIIIGEDIRQEIGNKLSLMGIVGDSINIGIPHDAPQDMQIPVMLASLITIEDNITKDTNDFAMQVTMSLGENQFAKMAAMIGANGRPRIFHIPVPKFQFTLAETSVLTVNAKITKNDEVVSEGSYILDVIINRNQDNR